MATARPASRRQDLQHPPMKAPPARNPRPSGISGGSRPRSFPPVARSARQPTTVPTPGAADLAPQVKPSESRESTKSALHTPPPSGLLWPGLASCQAVARFEGIQEVFARLRGNTPWICGNSCAPSCASSGMDFRTAVRFRIVAFLPVRRPARVNRQNLSRTCIVEQ